MQSASDTSILPPDPPFWTKTAWIQIGYGIWVNLTSVGIGMTFAFPSVAIPQLLEADSSIKINLDEESWIASALTLSSPIGCMLCGLLMDKYGRRIVLVLCEVPMCIGWFYAGFAPSAKHVIYARIIAGIGYGMALIAPRAYISEITLSNMRGVVGALPNFFVAFGLSWMAGLATFLSWRMICYICGCFSAIVGVSKIFLPDSPYYLLLNATKSYARVNLQRFRSSKFNISAELDTLNDFRVENNIRSLNFVETVQLIFKPSTCKPYAIITAYLVVMQLAGVHVVMLWTIEMMESSNISIDATMANFMLALSRIVFAGTTLLILYKLGRRTIALISAIGVGIISVGHCIFLYTYTPPSIVPLFTYMAFFGFATFGYYTIPFVMLFELLPLQVRGIMSAICFSEFNLLIFLMNMIYPYMRSEFGLPITMAIFGCFSFLAAVIIYFILPETKNLTLQEIEEYFNSRRPSLVSQRSVMSNQLIRHGSKMYKPNMDIIIQKQMARTSRMHSKELDLNPKITKPKEKLKAQTKETNLLLIREVDDENTEDNNDPNRNKGPQSNDPNQSTCEDPDQNKGPQSNDPNQSTSEDPDQNKGPQSNDPNQSTSEDPDQNKGPQSNDPNQSTSEDPDQNKGPQSNDPNQSTSEDPDQNKGDPNQNDKNMDNDPNQKKDHEPGQNK